jgi:hypothetical protein
MLIVCGGCQGGLPNLQRPAQVPPPPIGSYPVPSSYTQPTSGGSTADSGAKPTTLGQLRKLEAGNAPQERFTAADVSAFSMTDQAIATKPVLASAEQPIPPPRAAATASPSLAAEPLRWQKP